MKECGNAIYLVSDCVEAFVTRSKAYQQLDRHEESLRDLQYVCDNLKSDETIQGLLRDAQFQLRKAQRPDYYAMLGVSRVAAMNEIKDGYKAAAIKCHPDKVAAEEREAAEEKFKLLGEAHE